MSTTADVVSLDEAELPILANKSPEYIADPFSVIRELRENDPRGGGMFRVPEGVDVTAYDMGRVLMTDTRFVTVDPAHFEQLGASPLLMEYLRVGKMTIMRGDRHLDHRRMLTPPLSLASVDRQRQMYFETADRLIDGFIDDGEVELIDQFTNGYPLEILCDAIGVPMEDVPIFADVVTDVTLLNAFPLEPHMPAIENALLTLSEYVRELLSRPREEGSADFIDDLIAYEKAGRMTHLEIVWSLVTLIQAAHFTTRNQLASMVRALLENDLWDDVAADPSLIPAALDESMRYYPIILAIARQVADEAAVVDGVEIPPGTVIRWNPMAASRDPRKFDDPDRFDLARDRRGRTPFGFGIHKCLGHNVARTDMETALRVLTQRLKNPRILGPVELEAKATLWGPRALRIAFDAGSAPADPLPAAG